jgi:hypothetical protein
MSVGRDNTTRSVQYRAEKYKQFGAFMNQRAVRSSHLYRIFIILSLLALGVGCGGALDDFDDEEFVETTDFDEPSDDEEAAEVSHEFLPPASEEDQEWGQLADDRQQLDERSRSADGNPDGLDFLKRSDARALWLWSEAPGSQAIIENGSGAQDEFIEFATAPHGYESRALNRVFFEARQYKNEDRWAKLREITYDPLLNPEHQENLHAFVRRAKSEGMAVEYLDGQAIWVASDDNAEAAKQLCRDVVTYNESTDELAERFDGIHLDIEPHTVREGPYGGVWWENRLEGGYNAEWTERWMDILDSCRATLDDYEGRTSHRMTLAADVGTDYSYYNKPILDHLNRADGPLDYLGVMNYFDNRPNDDGDPSYFYGRNEDGTTVGGVIENLAAWDKLPVMFAMETGPPSIAPDWQSFYENGHEQMYETIDTLVEEYDASNMIGVAIHHYGPDSYRALQP